MELDISFLSRNCWTKAMQQNQAIAFQILAILAITAILAIHTSYEIPNIFG